MLGQVSRIADLVEKTKRHIENYKKQDIFADATQAREGIETGWHRLKPVPKLDATQAREGIETISCSFETPLTQMQLKPVRALKLLVRAIFQLFVYDATQAREGIETDKHRTVSPPAVDATQAREGIETTSRHPL